MDRRFRGRQAFLRAFLPRRRRVGPEYFHTKWPSMSARQLAEAFLPGTCEMFRSLSIHLGRLRAREEVGGEVWGDAF